MLFFPFTVTLFDKQTKTLKRFYITDRTKDIVFPFVYGGWYQLISRSYRETCYYITGIKLTTIFLRLIFHDI